MKSRAPAVIVCAMSLIFSASFGTAAPALAQAPVSAWGVESEGFEAGVPDAVRLRGFEPRVVRANLRDLDLIEPGDVLRLDLSASTSAVVSIHRVTRDRFNGHVIAGTIQGAPNTRMILVLEPDGIGGSVTLPDSSFEIRWLGEGLSSVMRNDPAKTRRGSGFNDAIAAPAAARQQPAPSATAANAATSVWDLLHVYTKVAASQIGGKGALKTATKVAVANWNEALTNSGIDVTVRLVANKKVKYTKRGVDGDYAVEALRDLRTNGVKKALKFRSKFGADIVSMAVEINDIVCGVGYLPGNGHGISASDGAVGFHVNSVDCLSGFGGLTMAHEGGHNVGLNHDPANASARHEAGAYSYSFGHRVAGRFRTVMSYSCAADGLAACPEISYYSTPLKKVDGTKVGVKKKTDNAKSIKKSRDAVEDYTACKKGCNNRVGS